MKTKKPTKTTSTDLSTISANFEFHADPNTNNLSIVIELEYPQFLTAYLDVIENYVKTYGKKYKIDVFYTVNNWSSCNMWVFTTNIPFQLVV
ncbi:MAG: hypothetical protein WCJ03_13055, partial [Bacteroidales bacterium]